MRARGVEADVQPRPGELGQYDVLLDGEVIASRRRSVLSRLLGSGWPAGPQVVETILERRSGVRS